MSPGAPSREHFGEALAWMRPFVEDGRMKKKASSIAKSHPAGTPAAEPLFQRVSAILDQAHASVARAINSEMVLAYWHIGREIVEAIQGGEDRRVWPAGHGRTVRPACAALWEWVFNYHLAVYTDILSSFCGSDSNASALGGQAPNSSHTV